jgi:hypothetical protein
MFNITAEKLRSLSQNAFCVPIIPEIVATLDCALLAQPSPRRIGNTDHEAPAVLT